MPTPGQIADAIASQLTAACADAQWGGSALTVTRAYLHTFQQSDTTFRASVTVAQMGAVAETRALTNESLQIVVTLSKLVADVTNATLDPLANTVQAVLELWARPQAISGIDDAFIMTVEAEPFCDPQLLDEKHLFVSIINVGVEAHVAGPAVKFTVTPPATATAGVVISVVVTALNANKTTAKGYTGTVAITTSHDTRTNATYFGSTNASGLPSSATLSSGVGTFSVTLRATGSLTVTATDASNTTITGTSGAVAVSVGSLAFVSSPSQPIEVTRGIAGSAIVTARDTWGNTFTAYAGTVHFTCSDGTATLPSNSTLTSGTGTFSVTLNQLGTQLLTLQDTVNTSFSEGSVAVNVS